MRPDRMRVAPETRAAGVSVEIPGAAGGRVPRMRPTPRSALSGMMEMVRDPASSALITSEAARPIQSSESSPVRFSKRTMARRGIAGFDVCERDAPPAMTATDRAPKASHHGRLKHTRFHGEQLLKFRQLAKRDELRVLHQLLPFVKTLFERLANVEEGPVIHALLRISLRQV